MSVAYDNKGKGMLMLNLDDHTKQLPTNYNPTNPTTPTNNTHAPQTHQRRATVWDHDGAGRAAADAIMSEHGFPSTSIEFIDGLPNPSYNAADASFSRGGSVMPPRPSPTPNPFANGNLRRVTREEAEEINSRGSEAEVTSYLAVGKTTFKTTPIVVPTNPPPQQHLQQQHQQQQQHSNHKHFTPVTGNTAGKLLNSASFSSSSSSSSSNQGLSNRQRGYLMLGAAVLAVVGFGVGIGIGVSVGKANSAASTSNCFGEGGEGGEGGNFLSSSSENGETGVNGVNGLYVDSDEKGENGESGENGENDDDEENANHPDIEQGGGSMSLFPSGPPPAQPQRPTAQQGAAEAIDPFDYASQGWYNTLMALPVTKQLRNSDFNTGTFRITKPGRYQLQEDIYFAPNAGLADPKARYWPPIHSKQYPMGSYFLGYFAAVTIETSNVWLDLNGFSIQQREDFYLRQRFYSNVELSDRAFVSHEGVASLNFEDGDKLLFTPNGKGGLGDSAKYARHKYGDTGCGAVASRTVISGGTLGLSSHAGVHGNGNNNIVLQDLKVKHFEVVGVQFNGGDNVAVVESTIGPSNSADRETEMLRVPGVLSHKVSNAVYTSLVAQRYLPGGLMHLKSKYPDVPYNKGTGELAGTIMFADMANNNRGADNDNANNGDGNNNGNKNGENGNNKDDDESNNDGTEVRVQWVFDRLWHAQELYFDWLLGKDTSQGEENVAKYKLSKQEVITFFGNPTGKPDGSALYGILLHRIGAAVNAAGSTDEPYYGPEHGKIKVRNVNITGLHHHTVTVPSLAFADGSFMQGSVRNVIPLAEVVDTRLQAPAATHYKGNILSDAYLALWKLSSEFYTAHVLDSPCGNFASNLTSRFGDCQGTVVNKDLTGRDIAMLQKKLFGGVAMSQAFYDWATVPGSTLDKLIAKSPDVLGRRQGRHYITCGHDTMFHPNKGVYGMRVEFVSSVLIENVAVTDVDNTADAGHWLCGEKYRLPATNEMVEPRQLTGKGDLGANVHGIAMAKVDGVTLSGVLVHNLVSLEGEVVGVELAGDKNDRRNNDNSMRKEVTLDGVHIGTILAGAGHAAQPLSTDLSSVQVVGTGASGDASASSSSTGGITVDPMTKAHNQLDPPKVSIRHAVSNLTIPTTAGNYIEMSFNPAFALNRQRILDHFNYTDAQMNAFAFEALAHFESEFGVPLSEWRRVDEAATKAQQPGYTGVLPRRNNDGGGEIEWELGPEAWHWDERLVLNSQRSIVFFGVGRHPGQDFHTESMCYGAKCVGPLHQSPTYNYVNLIMLLDKSEKGRYLAHGVFGGPEGKIVYPSQIMIMGAYLVENPPLVELGLAQPSDPKRDLAIKFYGTCPIDFPGNRVQVNPDRVDEEWRETSLINCKLDGGELLGKGWGVGAYIFTKENGMYTLEIADHQTFDDAPLPSAPTFEPVAAQDRCGADGAIAAPLVSVQVRIDGVTPALPPFDGRELLPFSKQYHQFHEAAAKMMARWTSIKTEVDMQTYRHSALKYFRDTLKIGTPVGSTPNPNIAAVLASPFTVHAHNDIALGGGSIIFPYAVNDVLNQRAYVIAGTALKDLQRTQQQSSATGAMIETGFILIVGRAGIHSAHYGYLPYGTVARYGILGVQGLGNYGDVQVQFHDRLPMQTDLNDHYIIDTVLSSTSHPDLAVGKGTGLVSSFAVGGPNFDGRGKTSARAGAGVQHNTRYAMVFGSYENPFRDEQDLGMTCVHTHEMGEYYRGVNMSDVDGGGGSSSGGGGHHGGDGGATKTTTTATATTTTATTATTSTTTYTTKPGDITTSKTRTSTTTTTSTTSTSTTSTITGQDNEDGEDGEDDKGNNSNGEDGSDEDDRSGSENGEADNNDSKGGGSNGENGDGDDRQ